MDTSALAEDAIGGFNRLLADQVSKPGTATCNIQDYASTSDVFEAAIGSMSRSARDFSDKPRCHRIADKEQLFSR